MDTQARPSHAPVPWAPPSLLVTQSVGDPAKVCYCDHTSEERPLARISRLALRTGALALIAVAHAVSQPVPEAQTTVDAPAACPEPCHNYYSSASSAVSRAGTWLHVWLDSAGHVSRSVDFGETWSAPHVFPLPDVSYKYGNWFEHVAVAPGENGTWMLSLTHYYMDYDDDDCPEGEDWKEDDASNKCEPNYIYSFTQLLYRSTDDGMTWNRVYKYLTGAGWGRLVHVGGGVWFNLWSTGGDSYAVLSEDDGATWGAARQLFTGRLLDFAHLGGTSWLLLVNDRTNGNRIQVHRSGDDLASFNVQFTHFPPGGGDYRWTGNRRLGRHLIRLDQCEWVVVWPENHGNGSAVVMASRSNDGGHRWRTPRLLLEPYQHRMRFRDNGRGAAIAMSVQADTLGGLIGFRHSSDAARTFSPSVTFAQAATSHLIRNPEIVYHDGRWLAAWSEHTNERLQRVESVVLRDEDPAPPFDVEGECRPRPLPHSADINEDGRFSLSELLRVIQFYNFHGYHCDVDTEDEFAPGVDTDARHCAPHASDYIPQNWIINLTEVIRLIQLFNTGAYHRACGSEDGFAPGPGPDTAPTCE